MNNAHIVYREWPRDVIDAAVTEFNAQMHDGAGADEISAGLHGLDFLTRRSEIDDALQARLDGAIVEGRMRVELLRDQEAQQRDIDEGFNRAISGLESLKRQAEHILERARAGFACPGAFYADDFEEDEAF